jgi:hypothetical protein
LNIRANTTGNVGSVVFDLNEMKNYRTENVPPFALGGDSPPGNYYEVPEIKEEGFFILTATPYSMARGKGAAGTPLMITLKTSVHNITENHIIDFVLVNAEADEDIMVIHDGSTLDLGKLAATSFNIRAVTQVEEIPGGRVVFDYDGKKNFRTERVTPYALGGDINGDYASFPLLAGQHTLKGTVFPEYSPDFYAKSITFQVVNNQEVSFRKSNSTFTSPKETTEEELPKDFSKEIQTVLAYPNPTESTLSIRLPDTAQSAKLYLYNAQGHKVMETPGGNGGLLIMDVGHLAAGMYLLKVASDQSTEMHRILLK